MEAYLVFLVFALSFDVGLCSVNKAVRGNKPNGPPSVEYYTKPHHGVTIPIMVHLDKPLLMNHSKKYNLKSRLKAKTLFRRILKDVEKLFGHSSLNQTVQLMLLDVKILKNATKHFAIDDNVSKYLKSYCQWQGEKKILMKKWYFSVLLTGLDLYYINNHGTEIRSSKGRGYMKGMCSTKNSCSLLEWDPENLAYILTHEIAHSLGISHDGPPYNECKGQRHIMDGSYNPRNPAKSWSPCNKRALEQFLESKYAWCLRPKGFS